MQTHYFIALSLPLDVKAQLASHYDEVSIAFPFQKPVHKLDYHVTLAFLGAHDEERMQELMKDLAVHTKDFSSFPLTIDGYGTFGNAISPRIFWNRLTFAPALFDLQQIVANCCRAHEIGLEARPYNPHITIARKWAGEEAFHSELLEQQNPFKDRPLSFIANEIVLYRTNLEAVPKYENIFCIPLKNHEAPL